MIGQDERIISIDTLGPHRLVRCLVQARNGRVWDAERLVEDDKPIRSLIVRIAPTDDPEFRTRMLAVSELAGRGWATPTAVTTDPDGRRLIVHELGADPLLDEWLRTPHGLDQRLAMAVGLAEAIDAAHDLGLTHDRLSPGCVIVHDGGPSVVDLPMGHVGTADAVRDDRWSGPWENRSEGAVVTERRRLAAAVFWVLSGRTANGSRDHAAELSRAGVSGELNGSVCRGLAAGSDPVSAAAFARVLRASIDPAPVSDSPESPARHDRRGARAGAMLAVGLLAFTAGWFVHAREDGTSAAALAAYESVIQEQERTIASLEQREALRRKAIGSVQDTLAYREYGAGITPNSLHVLGLIEMLTWPLDGSEESVAGRARLHAERMQAARELVDRAHVAADAEHVEVMLTELALGSWLFQSGRHAEAAAVLESVSARLEANLQPSDPLRRGAGQLYQLASNTRRQGDPQFVSNLEPWVARVLANPIDAEKTQNPFDSIELLSVAVLGEGSQFISDDDVDFTMRMRQQLIHEKLLLPTP